MSEKWFRERAARFCYDCLREDQPDRLACSQEFLIEALAHELEETWKEAQVRSEKEFPPGWPKRC
jgi:hypothetical protein